MTDDRLDWDRMTSTSRFSRLPLRTTLAAGAIASLVATAWVGTSLANGAVLRPAAHQAASSAAASAVAASAPAPTKHQLLHPKKKYYGISLSGAPHSLAGVTTVTKETGKQPNLLMFFEAWDSAAASGTPNIETKSIAAACKQGLLPMLTWESWDTSVHATGEGVAYAQKAFAPSKIIAGKYDTYIRATATAIKSLGSHCPVALRFDQEENGYWYPWGVDTTGMGKTTQAQKARDYILMWRHVWRIFKTVGATNVLWTWSPNIQNQPHPRLPDLSATYPGAAYVDWVAIDGYYNETGMTFADVFDTTIDQVKAVAANKPWIVGETGVGSFPDKASEITNLLHAVLAHKRFDGLVYFDQHKASDRSNWPFEQTPASLAAFKAGINSSKYATGKPGSSL
jgi:hypothetical protein